MRQKNGSVKDRPTRGDKDGLGSLQEMLADYETNQYTMRYSLSSGIHG
jgi:hypothetical protein